MAHTDRYTSICYHSEYPNRHYSDVIMVGWRLKSPTSPLFIQPCIQVQIKENIKASRHWPLCGEFTGDRWIPAQMASNAENISIWWRHHGSGTVPWWVRNNVLYLRIVICHARVAHPLSLDTVDLILAWCSTHKPQGVLISDLANSRMRKIWRLHLSIPQEFAKRVDSSAVGTPVIFKSRLDIKSHNLAASRSCEASFLSLMSVVQTVFTLNPQSAEPSSYPRKHGIMRRKYELVA